MVDASEYSEWQETLETVAKGTGSVVLLGGTDTGKTTFARLLANKCIAEGQSVAILDADPGQSEIGPPACLGLAYAHGEFVSVADLPIHALGFLGRTTPHGSLLEYFALLVRLAEMIDGQRLIIDMSGYIGGNGARQLYHACLDVLAPSHVVALQRKGEINGIVAPLQFKETCLLHQPKIPAKISKKPAQFRSIRRTMRFAGYFKDAEQQTYSFDEVAFMGTWLGTGTPVPAHILKYLCQMVGEGRRVFYAETCGTELGIMLNQPLSPHSPALGQVMDHLKVQSITMTLAPHLKNVLLGLEDGRGKMLGMGILTALDFRRRTFGVVANLRTSGAVKTVRFGSLRVQPDGTELGSVATSTF